MCIGQLKCGMYTFKLFVWGVIRYSQTNVNSLNFDCDICITPGNTPLSSVYFHYDHYVLGTRRLKAVSSLVRSGQTSTQCQIGDIEILH